MQRLARQLQPMRSLFLWNVYVVNAVNKFCSIGPWISTIWRSTKPRMLFSSNVWRCFSIWSPINLFVPVLIFSTMLMPVSLFKTGQRVMPGSGKIRPKKVCGEITLRPSSLSWSTLTVSGRSRPSVRRTRWSKGCWWWRPSKAVWGWPARGCLPTRCASVGKAWELLRREEFRGWPSRSQSLSNFLTEIFSVPSSSCRLKRQCLNWRKTIKRNNFWY